MTSILRPSSLLVGLMLLHVGCSLVNRQTKRIKTPSEMEMTVKGLVASGQTIDEAMAIMQREGFECVVMRNESFCERRHWSDNEPTRENIDFIRCRRINMAGHVLMERVWNVGLVLEGETTTGEVLISHYVDGP